MGEGSGLGLSVVHGIVKSHRGDITTIDNQPQGTIFQNFDSLNYRRCFVSMKILRF